MLELYPWCMIVNTFGGPVSFLLSRNKVNLCRIPHNGIVAPPTMEENFHISVHIKGTWYTSAPLQLAKSDWSQTFYMPKITGTIPLDGNVTEAIYCDKYVCLIGVFGGFLYMFWILGCHAFHIQHHFQRDKTVTSGIHSCAVQFD